MVEWTNAKILVWGITRPDLSNKYEEIVCTGGVFEETRRFVRLYPVPLRLLEDASHFHKYEWVTVDVSVPADDQRPESRRVNYSTLKRHGKIETKNDPQWLERAKWLFAPNNVFASVEALKAAEEKNKTSLGIVKPKSITKFYWESVSAEEKQKFWENHKRIVTQRHLFVDQDFRLNRPLPPPEVRFFVQFRCDDAACVKDHTCSILDWELDALRSKKGPDKVIEALDDMRTRDLKFFMGNSAAHPKNFMVVGLWRASHPAPPVVKKTKDEGPTLF